MPARPRLRGSGRKIPSTIRRMDKQIRKRSNTPPPPRIALRSPRRRSISPRRLRGTQLSRSPFKRSPKRALIRKTVRRSASPENLRPGESSKGRDVTPQKSYSQNIFEGQSESRRAMYSEDDLKNVTLEIEGYKKMGKKSDNLNIIRTFNPDNFVLARRPANVFLQRGLFDQASQKRQALIEKTTMLDYFCLKMRSLIPSKRLASRGSTKRFQGEGSAPIFEGLPMRKNDEIDLELTQSDRLSFGPSSSFSENIRDRNYFPEGEKERTIINTRRPVRGEFDSDRKEERTRMDQSRYQGQEALEHNRSYSRLRESPLGRKDRFEERSSSRGYRHSLERERERDKEWEREREMERQRERGRDRERTRERTRDRFDERTGRRFSPSPRRYSPQAPRRYPSPSPKRHSEHGRDYEERRPRSLDRRSRSLERFSVRRDSTSRSKDREYFARDKFSSRDHSPRNRGFDGRGEENPGPSTRGRGGGFFSGRGGLISSRPFIRNAIIRPLPPVSFRGMPLGRGPLGRRPPFPPSKLFRGPLPGRL